MGPDTGDHRRVSFHHWRKSDLNLGFGVACSFHDGLGLLTPGHKVLVFVNIGHHIMHFLHRKAEKKHIGRLRFLKKGRKNNTKVSYLSHILENYPSILRSEYSFLLLVKLMKFRLWGGAAVIVSQSWRQSTLGVLVIKMPHDDKCLKKVSERFFCEPHSGKECHLRQAQSTTWQYGPFTRC